MNHLDLWVRRGLPIKTPMPHIGGSDIVGVVDALGPGAEDVPLGLRVVVDPSLDYMDYYGRGRGGSFPRPDLRLLGEHTQGGFAEFAVVPAANLLEIPAGYPSAKAAAAGLVFVTAWRALMVRGGLRAGERVLVTGASGGVSTAAIQMALLAGAQVHAVTSGAENVARVRELGAHFVYDRLAGDFSRALWADTGKEGVDLVLDSVGEAVWESCLRSLGVGGRLVTVGATTGALGKTEIRLVFWKQLTLMGSTMGTPEEFRTVLKLAFDGRLDPVIHEEIPLNEIRRAHELLESGKVFGKLVVVP